MSIFKELEEEFKFMSNENTTLVAQNSQLIIKNNKMVDKIRIYRQNEKSYKLTIQKNEKELENQS